MFYTDDPHANWCFDSRSNRPPRVVAPKEPPPDPPPPSQPDRSAQAQPNSWPQLFTAVLDTLLPYHDAYRAVRQLTESVMHHLAHAVPDAPG